MTFRLPSQHEVIHKVDMLVNNTFYLNCQVYLFLDRLTQPVIIGTMSKYADSGKHSRLCCPLCRHVHYLCYSTNKFMFCIKIPILFSLKYYPISTLVITFLFSFLKMTKRTPKEYDKKDMQKNTCFCFISLVLSTKVRLHFVYGSSCH